MPTFKYQALSTAGERVKGNLTAANKEEAARLLDAKELLIQSLRTQNTLTAVGRTISIRDRYLFNKELHTLLKAGISLRDSLELICAEDHKSQMLQYAAKSLEDIVNGVAYSQSCAKYPEAFDTLYIAALETGEHTGDFSAAIASYVSHLEAVIEIDKSVRQALAYPFFLLAVMIIVIVVLFIFVIPGFQELFDSFGAKLPLATRTIIVFSEIMPYVLILLVASIMVSLTAWRQWDKPRGVNVRIDRFIQSIPIIGTIKYSLLTARWTGMLSNLLATGMPLTKALVTVQKTLDRTAQSYQFERAIEQVNNGVSLAVALQGEHILPARSIKLIEVGENSGSLEDMLAETSGYYQENARNLLKNLSSLFEPFVMLLIGFLVGAIIIAMYLPIFSLAGVVK